MYLAALPESAGETFPDGGNQPSVGVRPNDGKVSCQRPTAELLYLLVEAFCHLADLTAREIFYSQTAGQLLHLPGGHTLYERLLNDLNQRRFASFALGHKNGMYPRPLSFGNMRYMVLMRVSSRRGR